MKRKYAVFAGVFALLLVVGIQVVEGPNGTIIIGFGEPL